MAIPLSHSEKPRRLPDWLKVRPAEGDHVARLRHTARQQGLATVCEEARCPNLAECWGEGTATFMILGEVCTRGCRFCAVTSGNPNGWVDADEPAKLAQVIAEAGWRYVVLTAVDRDDLPDGGAGHFAACVTAIRLACPGIRVETLSGDFAGNLAALDTLLTVQPDVFAHNVETVARLTPLVRDRRASYTQSLSILAHAQSRVSMTKSSLMLGLGETDEDIHQTLQDLRTAGVSVLTLGQYLQPTSRHLAVQAFVPPEWFAHWKQVAETDYGFAYCAAGPLVRSSYRAAEAWLVRQVATASLLPGALAPSE